MKSNISENKSTILNTTEIISVEYPHINNNMLLLFCGYVFIWYLQIGYRIQALGAIRFELIYAVVLAMLAIFFTPKFNRVIPLSSCLILYIIVLIIQIPFSYDFNTSLDIFVNRIIKFAFMSFFIIAFVRSPLHMKYFLAAFLLACLKMGQEGLIGRISGGLIWENQGIMRLHGATPLYEHPNSFSGMALGTLPFVYFLWPLTNKYLKTVLVIIALLSLNIIIFTGSRTGYVGLLVFLLFVFITTKNKRKFLMSLAVVAIITIPIIPADYIERFDSIITGKEKEGGSIEARKEILKDAVQIFIDHPMGVGLAAFPKVRKEKFDRSQDTHNMYLEIATNLGIQGVLVVSFLFYKLISTLNIIKSAAQKYISSLESINNDRNINVINDLKLIKAVSLATTSFIFIRLTLGLFGMDLYEIYWWFAIGITIALYSMLDRLKIVLMNNQPD